MKYGGLTGLGTDNRVAVINRFLSFVPTLGIVGVFCVQNTG